MTAHHIPMSAYRRRLVACRRQWCSLARQWSGSLGRPVRVRRYHRLRRPRPASVNHVTDERACLVMLAQSEPKDPYRNGSPLTGCSPPDTGTTVEIRLSRGLRVEDKPAGKGEERPRLSPDSLERIRTL